MQRCKLCNFKINISNEIPVVFHIGSIYDYHPITKELVNEFQGELNCLKENTEKYKTFSVTITKDVKRIY